MSILWHARYVQIFMCVCVTRNYHQIYCELDAAAYIIGISVKSWVRQCLCRVDGGCMGLRMLWFAFGFVLSDALFQDFFTVPACLPQISKQLNGAPPPHVQDAFQTYQTESYWSFNIKHRHIIGQYWRSMPDFLRRNKIWLGVGVKNTCFYPKWCFLCSISAFVSDLRRSDACVALRAD